VKAISIASLLLSVGVAAVAFAAAPQYKIVDRIKVQDGGFDYATFDPATNQVLMARPNFTTTIDVKTGKVGEIKSAARGHIALPIPGTSLLVVTQRAGNILIVDGKADKVEATLKGTKNPDGATYDPSTKLVFAMNHDGGDSTVIDPIAKKVVGTIPIGGDLEFAVADGNGKVFVNIEDKNQIAVIDAKAKKVTTRYTLKECDGPTGLAYDAADKYLIASCDGTAKIVRADNGAEVASLKIANQPDAVIFDATRKLAFIPCRTPGVMEVISFANPAKPEVVQHMQTQLGTRTGTLDPSTGRIYMMAAKFGAPATAGGRPQALESTYDVLVAAP
jgi:DNA-binding beta-propeller fold protein YncE